MQQRVKGNVRQQIAEWSENTYLHMEICIYYTDVSTDYEYASRLTHTTRISLGRSYKTWFHVLRLHGVLVELLRKLKLKQTKLVGSFTSRLNVLKHAHEESMSRHADFSPPGGLWPLRISSQALETDPSRTVQPPCSLASQSAMFDPCISEALCCLVKEKKPRGTYGTMAGSQRVRASACHAEGLEGHGPLALTDSCS